MNCPRCGYVRSELDTHCLRCRILASEGRAPRPVSPAEQTVVMSDIGSLLSPPRPAFRLPSLSRAWVIALLVVLALAAGIAAGRLSGAPHPAGPGLTASASAANARG